MIYGYARASTFKQLKNGSSLEDQVQKLMDAGVPKDNIFQDGFTGTKMSRPQFDILMGKIATGDTLIVTKLDRFARTAVEGGAIVQDLHKQGIIIHILNMGIADNSPMGKLMVTMLSAFAEFERDMIVERTQSGRQSTGRVGGRPHKFSEGKMKLAIKLLEDGHSYASVAEKTGISKSTLIRAKKVAKNNE